MKNIFRVRYYFSCPKLDSPTTVQITGIEGLFLNKEEAIKTCTGAIQDACRSLQNFGLKTFDTNLETFTLIDEVMEYIENECSSDWGLNIEIITDTLYDDHEEFTAENI